MRITTILFDLDCTLYPRQTGLQEELDRRITQFIVARLRVSEGEADGLRQKYWSGYGTTVQGLVERHGVDPSEYYDYICDIPLDEFIQADPRVDHALERLSQRKVVFTNSPRPFADAIIGVLGIRRHFERVYSIEFLDHRGKPNRSAYRRVLDDLGAAARECMIVDDALHNLLPANELGLTTVLVGEDGDGADVCIADVAELPEALARLDGSRVAGR